MFAKYTIKLSAELGFALAVAGFTYLAQSFGDANATELQSAEDFKAFAVVGAAGLGRVLLVVVARFIQPILRQLESLVE